MAWLRAVNLLLCSAKVLATDPVWCSSQRDSLVGLQEPLDKLEDAYSFIKEQAGILKEGGCYEPPNCQTSGRTLVIVPYRNRAEHLNVLLRNLHPFLQRQKLAYCIVVSEQVNMGKFNKGLLMNAAFKESQILFDFDCVVFHDVDMLPEDDRNLYSCQDEPVHLSPMINKYEYKYPYGTDFGGVSMLKRSQYEAVNGHSNFFWGWGKEDSDIEWRIKLQNLTIQLPNDFNSGRYTMMGHRHTDSFQNEGFTKQLEDDRTTNIKKTLMALKDDRATHDGLNTAVYTLANIEPKLLYTNLLFDIEKIRWESISVKVMGHILTVLPMVQGSHCDYIQYQDTVANEDFKYKGVQKMYHMNKTLCEDGCAGFIAQTIHKRTIYNPIVIPLLQRATSGTRSSVHVKTCTNDLGSWQVIRDPVYVDRNTGTMTTILQFDGVRKIDDVARLFYRDSWVFEGKRIMTHNLDISKFQPVEFSPGHSTVYFEDDMTNDVSITVSLQVSGITSGYYAIYSKIVDSFGQPYAEINWLFQVKGGAPPETVNALHKLEMMTNDTMYIPIFKREMKNEFQEYIRERMRR